MSTGGMAQAKGTDVSRPRPVLHGQEPSGREAGPGALRRELARLCPAGEAHGGSRRALRRPRSGLKGGNGS